MKTEKWKVIDVNNDYDVSNYGNVRSRKTGKLKTLKGTIKRRGYVIVELYRDGKSKDYKVHQLVTFAFLNHTINNSKKLVIDHINNNKIDNRLDNLQLITNRENTSKDKINGSSKYTGVVWHKRDKKWASSISINKKRIHLGYFNNEIDAHNAYQLKLKEII